MSVYFAVTLSFCFAVPLLSCRSVVPLFCLSIVRLFIMLSFHRFFVLSFCCSVVLSFCLSIVLSFSLNLSVHLNSSKVVPVSFLTGVLTKFFLSYKLRTTPGPWTIVPINAQSSNPLTIEAQACCGILNKTGRWTTTKILVRRAVSYLPWNQWPYKSSPRHLP